MSSTSTPNLDAYGEKRRPFHRPIRPSLSPESRSKSKPTSPSKSSATLPPSLSFTHTSPPYDPLFPPTPFSDPFNSFPSKHHFPLSTARHSLPTPSRPSLLHAQTSPCTLPSTPSRAFSYPHRKASLPSFRPRLSLHRLRSSISVLGKLFAARKEEENATGEYWAEEGEGEWKEVASSLHLELPPDVSPDKSEIEYLRRMEREAMTLQHRPAIKV